MESQNISVLRQKNKRGLTAAAIVLCAVISPALGTAVFLPSVLSVVPVLLLALLGYVGPVSAGVCSLILIASCGTLFGLWGSVAMALLLLPTVAVSALMLEREQPFWQSVAAGGVAMFASMGVVVAMLSMLAGSDVVSALTDVMQEVFATANAFSDTMLSMLMQMGVLKAPEGVQLGEEAIGVVLDPETRAQMVRSLVMTLDSVLRLELPMQMATGAVTAGLLGQAALRKGVLSRGIKVEYPRLKTWHVPKGWGRILGGTLAILYLLAMLVPRSMNTMFYVFSGVFDKVFALQGVAALCYMMDKRGSSRVWQRIIFVIGYFLLGSFAVAVGVFDQAMDFSHRREELDKEVNPFDPRKDG